MQYVLFLICKWYITGFTQPSSCRHKAVPMCGFPSGLVSKQFPIHGLKEKSKFVVKACARGLWAVLLPRAIGCRSCSLSGSYVVTREPPGEPGLGNRMGNHMACQINISTMVQDDELVNHRGSCLSVVQVIGYYKNRNVHAIPDTWICIMYMYMYMH